jgi:hypothetical protein
LRLAYNIKLILQVNYYTLNEKLSKFEKANEFKTEEKKSKKLSEKKQIRTNQYGINRTKIPVK